ncbi:MAG: alanyl-tRNA synthetase AlaRS, alanyl-tRNA synthetase [Candidatus Woesebacteria bacterium GW2011_GWF1_31_35]|uniref:alanine--tRNA ligase n=1 Tax=Candidatus Woesebacteria bacterium GW2011_GWC2_31_9 TaxID=1618586 RepID=A0A0G0BJP6_9BACT|nr:MAG: alanyl-tRNA synthetase AlaRS, alanyl-tRNA synthetase [Candidatus Woesebacteria bacterium GW2011_GWF1_31_35]KKP23296.1 MAG: Alanine-tRNA ligase [Candidatus Woesebacteria bacterium GW2011_GWC1_30_29]KKP26185.1 MAG: Alanine-tRNA ligase [Candidatus Woesebacteria bacterium GW2011_GWD1_31_12]KKP27558.1 MAG: Alanine-tRNA ligase [Candidatus Woesebacteria bacterium GW2011_GWB1_31_29]KKP31267.1 MAG: Alanine-tRNA ligase [Candidatus Woesebacteria bacterium GW2011_GWC2_31_9]KKP34386.1 MAG: Alanine-
MITSNQIREKYLNFFEKKGSVIIPPAPLVLENDPTTLFTSSGMQPLVPYLMGEKHPMGKRLVDYQPSIRTVDIDEVGDNRHLTYFEMLGNWSLGDYFKKEQLSWIWEFLTKELELPKEKLYVSFFEGSLEVPEDTESFNIWKSLGLSDDHIFSYGVDKNWWSRSGTPNQMPEGEIGGPDSEIFFEFDSIKHDKKFGEKCHPNCDCGRFLEIGNSVFIQYRKKADGSLEELPQKNVDFGGGLERISAALNNNPDVFKTDIFNKTINKLEEITNSTYEKNIKNFRIIADHLRASEALTKNGVVPSNKQQGYILRRLIRKIATKLNNFELLTKNKVILEELVKFKSTLEKGLKEVEKIEKINGKLAFDLYQTYGFPIELTIELFEEKGQKVDMKEFKKEFEKHKEMSRSTSVGMFKGGLADHNEETTKLHTATHVLHASLREILGNGVTQKGSHITSERLRFDFSYPEKLTDEELEKVEELMNKQINSSLPISFSEMSLNEAKSLGALHFFDGKYGEKVKVYSIGDFSREVCGGPHVGNTNELGRAKIIKQEKVGSGVVRIYLKLAQNGH